MVGAGRRLATELVVIRASAIHEIHMVPGTALALDIAAFRGRSAAASAALIDAPPVRVDSGRRPSSVPWGM
ncbi:hypothetical protein GCM10025870_19280 [Agromyces marinus]|uniref:Uncharacterized protein n=1 Tax=Agromyces marinus TaxID=1389020 RepID=A0ABN6YFN4_9MICO|nr:hypothetical protein GCM10025870_19280 [Agromyces marinus]